MLTPGRQGVVFNLIIVRVGLGLSRSPNGRSTISSGPPSGVRFPLQKLSIKVSQHVAVSRDLSHTEGTTVEEKDDFLDTEQAGWKPDSIGSAV